MSKPLNVGIIGTGFMGRAHSNAYCKVGNFFDLETKPVLKAICALDPVDKLQAFADQWGYESYETDWRKLIARDDIDHVDICTPNNTHKDIVLAAAAAGKSVLCEKPLAMTVAEAEEMCAAVEKAGVANMVSFNYRRVPAISLAKQLIDEGRIGQPFHYRATYLQDWTISKDVPQGGAALWRLDVKTAGSGVTGDLLAHSIDTAEWLNGPIQSVVAKTETFVKQRMHQETGKVEPVGIDDACMFLAVFANGSMGTFESTRYARGRKNYNTFELNGENGSVFFDLEDPQYLDYFRYADPGTGKKIEDHVTGWQRIHVTNSEHPYMDKWWVPGCTIGYEHTFVHTLADFLQGLETGQPAQPDFRCGLRTQKVCDAVLDSARRVHGSPSTDPVLINRMNYFAHGRNFLDTPFVLAGTAVPDWLSVVDRRVRARARLARPWVDDPDPVLAGVARGVIRHHHDDTWFHQTRAFAELCVHLTREVRQLLPDDGGFRHSFLGHILVEILLDAALIEQDIGQLDAYYETLEKLDPVGVSDAVHRMATGRAERLPEMIRLFQRERFLYDYLDDVKLLVRLNRVMCRVKLPELPSSMLTVLASARQPVRERMREMLDDANASEF